MEKVTIFDTTLRDGEQAAGGTLNVQEKLEIARQLEKLGVDVIEAGFPVTSPGDFEAVRLIAKELRTPTVCVLTHAIIDAVDQSWEAVKGAKQPRIHIVLSSSDIHLFYQLRKNRDEIVKMSVETVKRARKYCSDVEFSAMDASRTEPEFMYRLLEAVIAAGATTVNVPDTVGYAMPPQWGQFIDNIFKNVPNIHQAVVSVHCHNDLGLAVANSLEALKHGARQVEGTINGIGERAGNAALEEIVMALKTREDFFNLTTGIDTTQIYKTSRLVSELTGFAIQANKAIVGGNAFRHSSGLHIDGMIKDAKTYQIIDPKTIGIPAGSLVLGKTSGRHAFRERLAELGYNLSDEGLSRAFAAFKELADKKKNVTDRDIESLVAQDKRAESDAYKLDRIQVTSGDRGIPTSAVTLIAPDGKFKSEAAVGTGPVDATCKVIDKIIKIPGIRLTEFTVNSVTEGIDAIGEVLIRVESEGLSYTGRGAHTDIIVASARAYVNALNRVISARKINSIK
ncbi:MAG: 2-isopropylmalate synthase [Dehalococcoidales bacterium]|nr:2-isopropylmalate synthase [Dehalococcoidales bacterium]